MRISDLPDRVFAFFVELLVGLFVVLFAVTFFIYWLARASGGEIVLAMAVLAVISFVANRIRERRLNLKPRPRNLRGAERTPILPPMGDES